MSEVPCEGWWEQHGFGRQPMEQLRLRFDGDKIVGAGVDVVGRFTLRGTRVHGQIAIVKRYIGQHDVAYVGTYDGEGTFYGMWRIGPWPWGGNWMIRIAKPASDQAMQEIHTLEPR